MQQHSESFPQKNTEKAKRGTQHYVDTAEKIWFSFKQRISFKRKGRKGRKATANSGFPEQNRVAGYLASAAGDTRDKANKHSSYDVSYQRQERELSIYQNKAYRISSCSA